MYLSSFTLGAKVIIDIWLGFSLIGFSKHRNSLTRGSSMNFRYEEKYEKIMAIGESSGEYETIFFLQVFFVLMKKQALTLGRK